jgi:hypothetical protein
MKRCDILNPQQKAQTCCRLAYDKGQSRTSLMPVHASWLVERAAFCLLLIFSLRRTPLSHLLLCYNYPSKTSHLADLPFLLTAEGVYVISTVLSTPVDMNRSNLKEAPVAMASRSPAATAGSTTRLVRPIARFAPSNTSSSSSGGSRMPLKKRTVHECLCSDGDDNEILEPPPLRRQVAIYWRPSRLDAWSGIPVPAAAYNYTPTTSNTNTTPRLGYKSGTSIVQKSSGDAAPLFGSCWSREPLFVDDLVGGATTGNHYHDYEDMAFCLGGDSEMEEIESSTTKPRSTQAAGGMGKMVAVTPSPHPMDIAQSPPPFLQQQQQTDPTSPMSPIPPPPLHYFHSTDALDQEGSKRSISITMNEVTCVYEHEHEFAGDVNRHHDYSPIDDDNGGVPLLAKLPCFIKPGATAEDVMEELIIPTPHPTPPRDFGGHFHHRHSSSSSIAYYDPAASMMPHPGAFATTDGWFETNSSFSPARIDFENKNKNTDNKIDCSSSSGNCSTATTVPAFHPRENSTATAHNATDKDQPLFLANSNNSGNSSAFASGQAPRDWHGGYYNA